MRTLMVLLLACLWTRPGFAAETLRGTGATFPAPLYLEWARAYLAASGTQVRYVPADSAVGIEKIRTQQTDFGATDAPLTQAELDAAGLVQFPVVIGGVVPVINISGIGPGQMALDGAVLADIFQGRIRRWNDARIAALNPGLALPSSRITVVHRADPSGSSMLWCRFLAQASAAWRESVGAHLLPAWPTGEGGQGNEGVASIVQRTRFAIGYVEYAYARAHHLSDVLLVNAHGDRQRAGAQAFLAAVSASHWQDAWEAQLPVNVAGADAWPVTGASFVLLAKSRAPERNRAVLKFFDWALREGASAAQALDYAPLPPPVVVPVRALWPTIRNAQGNAAWP